MRECLRRNTPGPYQIQAAINAVHSDAPTAADTDWSQIVQLYGQLLAVMPSPVVELNRAIALAELDGPGPALAIVEPLDLDSYHLYHAVRADLLARLGRADEARRGVRHRAHARGQRGGARAHREEASGAARRVTLARSASSGTTSSAVSPSR